MKRSAVYWCVLCLCGTAMLLWPSATRGWGCKGHQTIALIAEKHLTPEAKQFVQKLLSENPIDRKLSRYCGGAMRDAMADSSTWADDVRPERKNGPWHYIDIPRGSQRGPLEPFCGKDGCVTRAITEQLAILEDKNADATKRAEALRYVIHFVGDLHQPLHTVTNADEGGNCVPVKYLRRAVHEHNHSFSPNLHGLWDTAIPERDAEGADPNEYAETLDATFASEIDSWQKAGIHLEDWVWEGFDFAESTVYGNLTPKIAIEPNVEVHSCSDDNNIGERLLHQNIVAGESYEQKAEPVVENRIAEAGVRLAMILNDAAKGGTVEPFESCSEDRAAARTHTRQRQSVLSVLDVYTRECVTLEADRSMTGKKVAAALERAQQERGGLPESITVDNGSEFSGRALEAWAMGSNVQPKLTSNFLCVGF